MKTNKFFFIFIVFLFTLQTSVMDIFGESLYKEILSKKLLRIGISIDYPPLNFNKGTKGVEIELAHKLSEFLGIKYTLVPLSVSEYIPAIVNNKVDIVIAGMSRNLERGKTIWFSQPYLVLSPAVLVNKRVLPQTQFGEEFEQAPIKTLWDLKRLPRFTFAVKKGSTYENILQQYFPDSKAIIVSSNQEGLEFLQKGKVQGFIHDSLYLQYIYRNKSHYKGLFKLLSGGKHVEKLSIGLPFGSIILKNQINFFISEMLRQGKIEKWLEKYSGQ